MKETENLNPCPIEMNDSDIVDAMKHISGYLDITPGDFKQIYTLAYRHAVERLTYSIKAGHIMCKPVIKVLPDSPLLDVAMIMAENAITGLPVVDSLFNVVGVISEKDFLREMGSNTNHSFMALVSQCLKNSGCMAVTLRNLKAQDIMSSPAITVREETSVSDIVALFENKRINRVPVVDKDSRLCGMVTRSDIVQSYCVRTV